jgi:hypothetical protein
MSHAAVVWRDTPGDRLVYTANDTRKMDFTFFGYYKRVTVGSPPPNDSLEAITAAETAGANLRIDGEYAGPTGTYTPSGQVWILSGLTVERLDNTNSDSDVVWVYRVSLELAGRASQAEPYVELTTQAGSANVSAFRIAPTIPTDMVDEASDAWTASNDSVWHAVSDIGGRQVDWNGQPIQYALPILTTTMTVQRAAPIWLDGGTRDTGAIDLVASASAYIGRRNSGNVGFIGNTGHVLFAGITCSPLNKGLYNVTYTFRSHPWKHAIQVPRVIGSMFAEDVNPHNAERTHNEYVWWSQPHLAGADFLCDLGISSAEWEAVGITATCS